MDGYTYLPDIANTDFYFSACYTQLQKRISWEEEVHMFGQMQPIGSRSVQFVNGRMSAEAYAMAPNSQEHQNKVVKLRARGKLYMDLYK